MATLSDDILKKAMASLPFQLTLDQLISKTTMPRRNLQRENLLAVSQDRFSPRGAGGAIYVLESTEHFKVPVTVALYNVQIIKTRRHTKMTSKRRICSAQRHQNVGRGYIHRARPVQ